MSVLPGNPSVVASGAQTLQSRAGRIADAIELLRSIALEGKSEALDKIRSKTLSTSNTIQRAEDRYSATGIALSDYATKLRNAHKKADAAEERRRQARMEQEAWQEQRSRSVQQLRNIENSEVPQHVVDRVQAEFRHADRRADAAGSAVSSAQADIEAARQEMNAAAEHAIGLIEAAIDGTNDTFRDKISNFFAPLVEGFANFINWVGDHLLKLLTILWETVKFVFYLVLVVLAIIALAIVAAGLLMALPYILAAALVLIKVAFVVLKIVVFLTVTAALLIWVSEQAKDLTLDMKQSEYQPNTDYERLAYTEEQKRVARSRAKPGDFVYGERVEKDESYDSILDYMETMTAVDEMGGEGPNDDEAVVDIKKIDGDPPRWVVTIPSTQQEMSAGEILSGNNTNPNDWLHNLLLKTRPAEFPTAYEQQVLEAMRKAGIGPNDEVMVQGFSQGGIMAARLAANDNSGFNITGLITVGSPIDDVDLPHVSTKGQKLHVLTVVHETDPVPKLDIAQRNEDHPHYNKFVMPDPKVGGVVQTGANAHNSDYYIDTTKEILKKNPQIEREFSQFTAPSGDGHKGASVAEHKLVAIQEER